MIALILLPKFESETLWSFPFGPNHPTCSASVRVRRYLRVESRATLTPSLPGPVDLQGIKGNEQEYRPDRVMETAAGEIRDIIAKEVIRNVGEEWRPDRVAWTVTREAVRDVMARGVIQGLGRKFRSDEVAGTVTGEAVMDIMEEK